AVAPGNRSPQAPGLLAPPDTGARRAGAAGQTPAGGEARPRRPPHPRRGAGPAVGRPAARAEADLPRRPPVRPGSTRAGHARRDGEIPRAHGAIRVASILRTDMTAMRHPRHDILSAYAEGAVDIPRRLLVEAHLAMCAECSARLAEDGDVVDSL